MKSVQRHGVGGSLGDPIGPPVVGGVGAVVAIIDPEGEPVVLNQASVGRFALSRGGKRYELKNHLGNVLAVVTDLKLGQGQLNVAPAVVDFYLPEVVEVSDYFPFGWKLPGRNWRIGDRYRYAFQGQEGDDAWSGEEASVFFKYRVHDPRIGRFLSVDPLAAKYAGNSVYAFAENKVIAFVELEGLEARREPSSVTPRVVSPNSPHDAWVNEACAKAVQQATARNRRYIGPSFGRTASSAYTPGSMWALTESGWVEIPEEITPLPLDFHNSPRGVAYSYPDQLLARDIIAGKKPLSAAGDLNIAQRVDVAQRYYASRISQNPDDYSDEELLELDNRSRFGLAPLHFNEQQALDKGKERVTALGLAARGSNGRSSKGWPWKAEFTTYELVRSDCEADALQLQQIIGGEIFTISNPISRLKLGPVKVGKETVVDWYFHKAVRVGDRIFDKITGSKGLHVDSYKKLFEYHEDLKFE